MKKNPNAQALGSLGGRVKSPAKARLSAYGMQALATVAKCSTDTVSRAVVAGDIDMESMESALIWVGNRRKKIKPTTKPE
jgi:hypothetical protein